MHRREIPRIGPPVFAIGLGCAGMSEFYGHGDDEASRLLIQRAVDWGVDLFDTSDAYGANGHNESLLAQALGTRRKDVHVATKFGLLRPAPDVPWSVSGRPEHVRNACDASLRRLRSDYIDLYYLHRVDPETPIEDTVGAMADLVKAGKVRALGLCEVSAQTLRRAMAVHPISAVQSEYSLWSRDVELNGVLATCEELEVAFVPYSPLGRAFLTGAVTSNTTYPDGDVRSGIPRFQQANLQSNMSLLERLQAFATGKGAACSQVALAWLLARSENIIPIPGTKREKYLAENLGAASLHLTADDMAQLGEIFLPGVAQGARLTPQTRHLVE